MSRKKTLVAIACTASLTAVLTFAGTVLWGRTVLQRHVAATYAVGNPGGIERLEAVEIGGVTQWLHIRGRCSGNPVLLYLHGGPGAPKIGTQDAIQRPWEDYFTVVHWDQRQTGKSYYPMDEIGDTMRLERMVADTEEVIAYLRQSLKHSKIFLLGHSWGSVLGAHVAKLRPEWIHAYIGVSQVVNMMDNERIMYERLRVHADASSDTRVLERLDAMSPFPNPEMPGRSYIEDENGRFLRYHLNRMSGEAYSRYTLKDILDRIARLNKFTSPLLTWRDLYNEHFGGKIAQYSPGNKLIDDVMAEDLPRPDQVGSTFEVPIFFFTGSHDWHIAHSLTEAWFQEIEAPYKELIWFEESAHAAPGEEPGKFLVAMVTKVLPFAYGHDRVPDAGTDAVSRMGRCKDAST